MIKLLLVHLILSQHLHLTPELQMLSGRQI